MYKCKKIKGLNSQEITSLPKSKTWRTWRVISIIAEKKNHMLITRLICIQWKFTTPDHLATPSKFRLSFGDKDSPFFSTLLYSLVPKKSTLSSDRIREPTRSGRARHLLNMLSRGDIYYHNSPLLACTHDKKRNTSFFKVSLLKQARLIRKVS